MFDVRYLFADFYSSIDDFLIGFIVGFIAIIIGIDIMSDLRILMFVCCVKV